MEFEQYVLLNIFLLSFQVRLNSVSFKNNICVMRSKYVKYVVCKIILSVRVLRLQRIGVSGLPCPLKFIVQYNCDPENTRCKYHIFDVI
jgi:hypothetical protein